MSGYLEIYGAGAEKRGKRIKRLAIAAFVIIVAGGGLYFALHNYFEVRQAQRFFDLLRKQDYRTAYSLWDCTGAQPCGSYPMERFLEDWGPKGTHADLSALKITKTRGCDQGVIVVADFGKGQVENLWVDRGKHSLGFSPWPVCNPLGSQVLGATPPTMTK
jgi:hypothetical protein